MCAILEFHERAATAWGLSPVAVLSNTVDEKRLRAIKPAATEMYNASFPLTSGNVFADINFCYEHGGNHITFTYLAGVYGRIAGAVKWLKQKRRKHAKVPELMAFYCGGLEDYDVYAAMKEDFAEALNLFDIRHAIEQRRWPNFRHWEPIEIRWDIVNEAFKAESKKYVEAQEESERG